MMASVYYNDSSGPFLKASRPFFFFFFLVIVSRGKGNIQTVQGKSDTGSALTCILRDLKYLWPWPPH